MATPVDNARRTPSRHAVEAAPIADAEAPEPAPTNSRRRTNIVVDQAMAPSTGTIPAAQRAAAPGATLRSRGVAAVETVSKFKEKLRSKMGDGAAVAALHAERKAEHDQAKAEVDETYSKMEERVKETEALRKEVVSRIEEVTKYLPRDLASQLTGVQTAPKEEKKNWLASAVSIFQKKQAEAEPLAQQSLSKALTTSIELLEVVALNMKSKHEALTNDQPRQAATRAEYQNRLERAISDYEDTKALHFELRQDIDDIKEEMADPAASEETKAALETELSQKSAAVSEMTRLAMFLEFQIKECRAFEKAAEQLANMTTTVLSSTEMSLASAFLSIDRQQSTALVITKISELLNSDDTMKLALEKTQGIHEIIVADIAKRVSTHQADTAQWEARMLASQARITANLSGANEASAAELAKASDRYVDDHLAGRREVFIPIRLPQNITPSANPFRAKSVALHDSVMESIAKKQASFDDLRRTEEN